ncbi:hypothetical protein ACLKA7_004934 [Drosophila subpalustris]
MKIFLQALWKENLDWDEVCPNHFILHGSNPLADIIRLQSQISAICEASGGKWEIHSFCDASMVAYGSCIYIRSETQGLVSTRLLCSKSRVAPLKTLFDPETGALSSTCCPNSSLALPKVCSSNALIIAGPTPP